VNNRVGEKIENFLFTAKIEIGVTCRVWAENARDKIDFELLIE
jgi:hypothetical protein